MFGLIFDPWFFEFFNSQISLYKCISNMISSLSNGKFYVLKKKCGEETNKTSSWFPQNNNKNCPNFHFSVGIIQEKVEFYVII